MADVTDVIYLDNNATTRVAPEVVEAMMPAFGPLYGNASSMHTFGGQMGHYIQKARAQVAGILNADPEEIIFTSCGSESDNSAWYSATETQPEKRHVITTKVEHSAVLAYGHYLEDKGYEVTWLGVDDKGRLNLEELERAIRPDTALVSMMYANNETGTIFPIEDVARIVKSHGVQLHVDAVQAVGKEVIDLAKLPIDYLALSGHKLHAPKGIGALYIRQGLKLPAHILGGGQEEGLRSGTEPMPQIAAFGEAVRIAKAEMPEANKRMEALRAQCVQTLTDTVPGIVFLGGGSAHILSLSLPGYRSEVLMNYLEAKGIYVSKSSACKRGKRSHVLEAIGAPDKVIDGALRVSFSRCTTAEECAYFCEALAAARKELYPSL